MIDYFNLSPNKEQLLHISTLGLAHLGDGVYELMVRSWLCMQGKATAKNLHKATVAFVSAPAQAQRAEKILPHLTEAETEVFKRGRNTAPHSIPKGAKRGDYQTATALEALFGWLYLQGETQRLNELFQRMLEE